MARKVKRKRTVQKRKTTQRVIASKKTNRHNFYLLLLVVAIFLAFIVYYFSSSIQQPQVNEPAQQNQVRPTQQVTTPINVPGGSCTKDSQCFITFCKDQVENCVNATQLSYYSNNCKTYSDWVVEKQDYSRCSCVQNACTMIK